MRPPETENVCLTFALLLVSMLAASCAASPPPTQSPTTTPAQSREHEPESQPKKSQALRPTEAQLVTYGGSFVGVIDTESGFRHEGFFLGSNGQYVWIGSAMKAEKPSPANEGPGYLRRGTWAVEGEALVLREQAQVTFVGGSDVSETESLTRTLEIGRCGEPKDLCVTLDGANFYLDQTIDADEEGPGLWPEDR